MSQQLIRASRSIQRLPQRVFSTSASCKGETTELDTSSASAVSKVDQSQFNRDMYPKIGNREVVGYGTSGQGTYYDRPDFPYPAVRFQEATPEIVALKLKEKGDWKSLSSEDIKQLYRTSFCQTFAEFEAPTGAEKQTWSSFMYGVLITILMEWFIAKYIYPPLPRTTNKEWQMENISVMIDRKERCIEGWGSFPTRYWDYEKDEWKK